MKNTINPVKKEHGMTLVEVLIAMLLLGIVAVAIFSGLSTAYKAYSVSQQHATAMAIAQSQVENTELQPYNEGASYPIISAEYPIALNITEVVVGLQKVVVTVTCPDGYLFTLETKKVQ